jgi:hypothetical protein
MENHYRSLSSIAREIVRDWQKVNYAAKPYLCAMQTMGDIRESYGYDSGVSVVLYFLSNASAWRGDTAKRIKSELKAMVANKPIKLAA